MSLDCQDFILQSQPELAEVEGPPSVVGSRDAIAEAMLHDGFARLPASAMRRLLGEVAVGQWDQFAASWGDLETDRFMKDGGTYRRRRHAVFSSLEGDLVRQPNRPHFQEVAFNHLNGGVARNFAPVVPAIADLPLTRALASAFVPAFDALSPGSRQRRWEIEMHQFRIEAAPDMRGLPTPEGVHRDGVDWVVMVMVGRSNVSGGVTSIEAADGTPLCDFLLQSPLDAVVLDDRRLRHGASPIRPLREDMPAHRDMLVLTYTSEAVAGAI